ncbi:hypothetical protein ANANG_G00095740 [Anguilla anguilla]|uniref:Uncharacterized protein n=1 Tax=Anguilla anguilla TaxID=7936 RepID=A0A9D3MHM7_ANGAN|nr:hypothetical protein ANANG_G00095740 [Anguilla anguilla]
MAARRGFQANGDITPVMRPVERLPLRNLQNELLGQQLTLSATKLMSSKPALKKKGEPVQVEELPHCSSLHGTSIGKARLVDTELTKENATVVVAVDDEPVLQKGCPDSLRAEVIDREMELQSRTSSSTVLVQSDHTEDITGRVLTERAGEGADTVDTQDQWASVGCLSDSSTSCVTQPATADSAVEHCTDNRIGDVTFKSFLCSGVELEIPDTSVMTEETLLLLTQSAADVSSGCSFQNDLSGLLSFSQHLDLDSSNRHEDHAYCFLEKDDSCSRDELLPVGTSVTEPLELEDPPGGLDPTGQALMSSECLETMQDAETPRRPFLLFSLLHGDRKSSAGQELPSEATGPRGPLGRCRQPCGPQREPAVDGEPGEPHASATAQLHPDTVHTGLCHRHTPDHKV